MAVLDVGDAVSIEEPLPELDAREEGLAIDVAARRDVLEQQRAEIGLHAVPMELDVVVAVDERQRVSVGDERRERFEDVGVAFRDARELHPCVVLCAAEPMVALFLRQPRVERLRIRRRDRHADEVDEVAGDDDAPSICGHRLGSVVTEQRDQIAIDRDRTARALLRAFLQVTAEVDVGEDQQALGGRRRR
jgi:hypothetical protein